MRTPWNDKLYAVLKELYSAEEADVVVRMPYGLSSSKNWKRPPASKRTNCVGF
jgi:hypothetical protein